MIDDKDDKIPGLMLLGMYMQAGCSASRAFDRAACMDCELPLKWAASYRGVSEHAIELSLKESAETLGLEDDPYHPDPDQNQAELMEANE